MALQIFKDIPDDTLRFGIFDSDNGIVDTESVFAQFDCALLNDVLVKRALEPSLLAADVRALAGHSGSEKLKIIAQRYQFNADEFLEDFNTKRTALRKTLFHKHETGLALGLTALLDHLGNRRALATNKKSTKLMPDMKAMGIADLFDVVITSDDLNKKPAPDVILKALSTLSAPANQSVYFGDNITDIDAALAAGTYAIGFIIEGLAGYEDKIEAMKQAGAHAVTDDYRDVIGMFTHH